MVLDLGSDGRVRRAAMAESSGDVAIDRALLSAVDQQKFALPTFSCVTFSTAFDESFDLPADLVRASAASPPPVPACGTPFVALAGLAVAGRAPPGTASVDVALDAAAHVDAVRIAQSSGNAQTDHAALDVARASGYDFVTFPGCPRAGDLPARSRSDEAARARAERAHIACELDPTLPPPRGESRDGGARGEVGLMLPAAFYDRLAVPVIGAPMFIISQPELVIAQCKAGVIGAFPSLNARPEAALDEWLDRIETSSPSTTRAHPDRAVRAVRGQPDRPQVEPAPDARSRSVVRHKVKIVITSLGARPDVNEAIHSYGGVVLHDVINVAFARKAIEKGADGLIAVRRGRRRTCRNVVAVRARPGDSRVVRRAAGAFGRDRQRPRGARGARHGRRLRLRRLRVHRDARGARRRRVQAEHRRVERARHRLHEPVHRRARELSARVDRARGPRPGEPAGERPVEDELRRRRRRRRGGTSGARVRASAPSRTFRPRASSSSASRASTPKPSAPSRPIPRRVP